MTRLSQVQQATQYGNGTNPYRNDSWNMTAKIKANQLESYVQDCGSVLVRIGHKARILTFRGTTAIQTIDVARAANSHTNALECSQTSVRLWTEEVLACAFTAQGKLKLNNQSSGADNSHK